MLIINQLLRVPRSQFSRVAQQGWSFSIVNSRSLRSYRGPPLSAKKCLEMPAKALNYDVEIDTTSPEATARTIAHLQSTIGNLVAEMEQLTSQFGQASLKPPQDNVNRQKLPGKYKQDDFDSSTESEDEDYNKEAKEAREFYPPPFFIKSKNAKAIMDQVTREADADEKSKPFFTTMNDGTVKILSRTENSRRKIRELLDRNNVEYHSHQLESEKLFRVVVRGLHPETDHNVIKSEFQNVGQDVVNISNVIVTKKNPKGLRKKMSLPLFFVDMKLKPNSKAAYGIKNIGYQVVQIEEPKSRANMISQCKNYQKATPKADESISFAKEAGGKSNPPSNSFLMEALSIEISDLTQKFSEFSTEVSQRLENLEINLAKARHASKKCISSKE